MAAPLPSRIPKANRQLIQYFLWGLGIACAIVLAWRFVSGDTIEHQQQVAQETKQRDAINQSAQGTPAAIAAIYDTQFNAPNNSVATPPAPAERTSPGATPANAPATEPNPRLRLPSDRPSTPGDEFEDTPTSPAHGRALTPQRIREQARASDLASYEDTNDGIQPHQTPVNSLMDQLKNIQQGAGGTQAQVADYLRNLQTSQAATGRPAAPTASGKSTDLDWLNGQGSIANADEEPLRPVMSAPGEYVLHEGTPIRIVLQTDISSDLPGDFIAMVTRDVYDSRGYGHKLISKGMMLRGKYNSEISAGQDRLLFAFHTMSFPSGARLRMKGMPGSDRGGAAGAEAEVDRHFWRTFGGSLAVGAVTMVAGRSSGNGSNVTINMGGSNTSNGTAVATQALSDVVRQMLQRNANIKDTLSLHKGEQLMIVTNREMDLPPSMTGVQ
ncbi:type IV secretory pathway, VirB10 component [Azospira oryzae PS]|jgi:type IV secretion system protein VirB10|uniref:Type IV secretory pathway, VirB10 component n=1 Tax=Azospira oryzae (strain ATCC BAA-33 / DSM 13638 / PS) TaxID=640081 RepID=G8QNP4_AZOOP|nr:TrbI/VirB10 family protein [Azospira oryzae]AEV26938.1 type IV secretory pathway, VirB10 component [Azospira oryzae PS]